MKKIGKKRIYLDYASATPMSEKARAIFLSAMKNYANPSGLHKESVKAKQELIEARKLVARIIVSHPDEIIFTSGGTEGDALAILGIVNSARNFSPKNSKNFVPNIITSSIEHPAILETLKMLEDRGEISVTYLSPKENGIIDPRDVREALRPETILVSIQYANNEIGVIQPIREIAKEIRHWKKIAPLRPAGTSPLVRVRENLYPYFHTDACQAVSYLEIIPDKLGVDLMTVSGSKIYGPKGSGFLFVRRNTKIDSIWGGGKHEFSIRPGTENLPAIISLAKSFEETRALSFSETKRLTQLRDFFISEIPKFWVGTILNGDRENCLPNIIHLSFPGIGSELLLFELDARGIAVSSKSACKSSDEGISHVMKALGKKDSDDIAQIRFSLGRETTKADLIYTLKMLKEIREKIERVRKILGK